MGTAQKFNKGLVGDIIYSNKEFMVQRLKILEGYIQNELRKVDGMNDEMKIPGKIDMLNPHITTFCKQISYCSKELQKDGDENVVITQVTEVQILRIFGYYEKCSLNTSLKAILHLMQTYLFLPKPFALNIRPEMIQKVLI